MYCTICKMDANYYFHWINANSYMYLQMPSIYTAGVYQHERPIQHVDRIIHHHTKRRYKAETLCRASISIFFLNKQRLNTIVSNL